MSASSPIIFQLILKIRLLCYTNYNECSILFSDVFNFGRKLSELNIVMMVNIAFVKH